MRQSDGQDIPNNQAGIDAFEFCEFEGCRLSGTNQVGVARLDPSDSLHLSPDENQPSDNNGDPFEIVLPPEAFSDVDGQCRGPEPDIGADER